MANALRMKKDDKYSALIQFIEMMNSAFVIMNIRCRSEGSKTRNKWKLPLTTTDDWRFEVGKKSFCDHKRVFSVSVYHLAQELHCFANSESDF